MENGKQFSYLFAYISVCNEATDLMTLSPMKVLKVNQMQLE